MAPVTRRRSGSGAQFERGTVRAQAGARAWARRPRHAASPGRTPEAETRQRVVTRRVRLLVASAAIAAAASSALAWTPGFSRTDTGAAILASAVAALLAIAVIPLAQRLGTVLSGSGAGEPLLFVAALASAGAAAIHFAAIKMHVEEDVLYAAFFVASGVAQLVWPIWLLLRRWPPLLVLGAVGNAAIVALWILDRVGGVPVGPDAQQPPPFGFGDSVASGLEVLLVGVCLAALVRGPAGRLRRRTGAALALGAAALTALALLSVLGVGGSILPPTK